MAHTKEYSIMLNYHQWHNYIHNESRVISYDCDFLFFVKFAVFTFTVWNFILNNGFPLLWRGIRCERAIIQPSNKLKVKRNCSQSTDMLCINVFNIHSCDAKCTFSLENIYYIIIAYISSDDVLAPTGGECMLLGYHYTTPGDPKHANKQTFSYCSFYEECE